MSKKEKLIAKLLSLSKSFTFEEAETLLGYFDNCARRAYYEKHNDI